MANRLDISDQTAVSMPMKNLLAIIAAVCIGVWAYFGVLERITMLETKAQLSDKDLNQVTETLSADIEKNNEFRIKWPRGELGSPPADSEQFMLIEHIAGQLEAVSERMEEMMNNGVNIKRLQEDVKILREDGFFIERLSQELRSDKDIAIEAVSPKNGGGPAYRDLDESIKNDPDVIEATKKGNLAEGYDENEGIG